MDFVFQFLVLSSYLFPNIILNFIYHKLYLISTRTYICISSSVPWFSVVMELQHSWAPELAPFHISWLHTIWVSVMDLPIQLVTLCLFFFYLRSFLLGKLLSILFQLSFLDGRYKDLPTGLFLIWWCHILHHLWCSLWRKCLGLFCSIFNDLDQFGALPVIVNRRLFHCSKKTGF